MSKKPVPSKKQSVSSSKSRHKKKVAEARKKLLNKYTLDTCPETGETKLRHFASPHGRHNGRQVFAKKTAGATAAPTQEIKA